MKVDREKYAKALLDNKIYSTIEDALAEADRWNAEAAKGFFEPFKCRITATLENIEKVPGVELEPGPWARFFAAFFTSAAFTTILTIVLAGCYFIYDTYFAIDRTKFFVSCFLWTWFVLCIFFNKSIDKLYKKS